MGLFLLYYSYSLYGLNRLPVPPHRSTWLALIYSGKLCHFFVATCGKEAWEPEPEFLTFKKPKNRFQGTNSARLCSLASRYDNPIPSRFLAPVDGLKISDQDSGPFFWIPFRSRLLLEIIDTLPSYDLFKLGPRSFEYFNVKKICDCYNMIRPAWMIHTGWMNPEAWLDGE